MKQGRLTAEFTQAVTRYLLVETELAPADVAIVFGSNGRAALAEKAAEVYNRGLVKRIIVSGGVYNDFKKTEAVDIAARLEAMGIPKAHIFIENRARNTGENVIYSKALAARTMGLESIQSIIAIGAVQASRRFLMTLKRHWPDATAMITPANPYGVDKEKWYSLPDFRKTVFREYRKIDPYLRRGFLAEVDIDDINRYARQKRSGPK